MSNRITLHPMSSYAWLLTTSHVSLSNTSNIWWYKCQKSSKSMVCHLICVLRFQFGENFQEFLKILLRIDINWRHLLIFENSNIAWIQRCFEIFKNYLIFIWIFRITTKSIDFDDIWHLYHRMWYVLYSETWLVVSSHAYEDIGSSVVWFDTQSDQKTSNFR